MSQHRGCLVLILAVGPYQRRHPPLALRPLEPQQSPREVGPDPPRARDGMLNCSPATVGGPQPAVEVGDHQPHTKEQPPPPRGPPLIHPPVVGEQAMAPGPAGTSCPCERPKAESLSPRGLLSQ